MTEKWQDEKWAEDIWYRGKVTRRTLVGWGGGAIGAMMLVPAPWRTAFGAEKPFKIGSEQPLSGAGAAGGKTAVVGLQMAADRINANGGINGRPVELVIADDESSPAVARQKTAKMVQEDAIDIHVGGFLSNICIACMPVWEDAKIVNMISVCLDTTLTTSKCNKVSFRVHDYAPAQAVAFGPMLSKMGKKWHIAYADYSWGQSTRDAYAAEIKKNGGEVVGTTGISARHRRHDAVPVENLRRLRRTVRHPLRQGWRDRRQPSLRSRPHQEIQICRRRRHRRIDQHAGARQQDRGVRRHQSLSSRSSKGRSTRRRCTSSSTTPRRGSRRSIRRARCPIATCSRTMKR